MKRKIFVGLILALLLLGFFTQGTWGTVSKESAPKAYDTGVIRINGNSDFDSNHGVIGGSGTKSDPYVISGWNIDAHGGGSAIYIGNTTAYFIVENCILFNTTYRSYPYFYGTGLMLYNVTNGTIDNNTIYDNSGYGISLYSSNNNTISNNTISNNSKLGIYIYNSPMNTFTGNKFKNSGILINAYSLDVFTTQNIDTSNTINGKPVYYYKNANMNNQSVPQNAGEVLAGNVSWLDISNLNLSYGTVGIELGFSSYVTIANNTIYNNSKGIFLRVSSDNIIENNTIYDNEDDGIDFDSANNYNLIDNNTVYGNPVGLWFSYSHSNTISNNSFFENDWGMRFSSSQNNVMVRNNIYDSKEYAIYEFDARNTNITGNTISDSLFGLYIDAAYNTMMRNNIFKNDGIFLYSDKDTYLTQDIDTSNTVNGKPIYYYKNVNMSNQSVPQDAGEVILGNVSWLSLDNISISNGTIGIEIGYSNNITITNSTMSRNYYGILQYHSSNSKIENNSFQNNNYGCALYFSQENIVAGNYIKGSKWGIYIAGASNNTLSNNTIYDGEQGIRLLNSDSNEIVHNLIYNNTDYGIYLYSGSSYNTVFNNSFYYNHGSGDYFDSIYVQAYDDGTGNMWNTSGSEHGYGNYWHDWANNNNTNDNDSNGIVDWKYHIAGYAGAKDWYPLKNATYSMPLLPPTAPLIWHVISGDGYVNLTWERPMGNGSSPITEYRIYRNGALLASVPSSQLYYNDTNVVNGIKYTYYITAVNSVGESAPSSEVSVTPNSEIPEIQAFWVAIIAAVLLIGAVRRRI